LGQSTEFAVSPPRGVTSTSHGVFAAAVALVLLAACSSTSPPSTPPATAFDAALSTMSTTQDLHVLVQSNTDTGTAESSDVVETLEGVHLQALSGGVTTEAVIVGDRGWERSPTTGGQWIPLADDRVLGTRRELNPDAESRCIKLEHGRLRSLGTRTFAKQKTWALADDGSAPGGIKGTWYVSLTAPYRIIGFTGVGPAGPRPLPDCGSPGPGPIQRLYSYEAAPPVTVPFDVASPPTTRG
jgi:hypothetical protein